MSTLYRTDRALIGAGAALAPDTDNDDILSAGDLMLLDMAHSLLPDGQKAALPLNATTTPLKNMAWRQAAALTGAEEDDLDALMTGNFLSADLAAERTLRDGLHVACSRSGMSDGRNVTISLPDAIKIYLLAHPTHRYFLSIEGMITRKALYASGNALPIAGIMNASGSTSNYLAILTGGDDSGNETGLNLGAELGQPAGGIMKPGPNTEGVPFYRDTGAWRWQNSIPASIAALEAMLAIWGAYGAWSTIGDNNAASWILYRVHLKDLTAANQRYEEASHASRRLFDQNIAVGGRWRGDIYTAPGILKP